MSIVLAAVAIEADARLIQPSQKRNKLFGLDCNRCKALLRLHDHGLWRGGRRRGRRLVFHGAVLSGVALQNAGPLRALVRQLHDVHHVLRDFVIGVAQRGSPGKFCRQLVDYIRKLREARPADVPELLSQGLHELIALEPGILSRPGVRPGEWIRMSESSEQSRRDGPICLHRSSFPGSRVPGPKREPC